MTGMMRRDVVGIGLMLLETRAACCTMGKDDYCGS